MPTFRYVVADVFTDRPLAGNQLAVFTDARELPEERSSRSRGRSTSPRRSTSCRPERRPRAHTHLHARKGAALRGASDPRHGVRARGAASAGRDPAGDGGGDRPGEHRAGRPRASPSAAWSSRSRRRSLSTTRTLAACGRVERSELPVELYDNGAQFVYVGLPSRDAVAALAPDFGYLSRLPVVGLYCFAGEGTRWKSRMFAPGAGVAEDPGTGSAAGPLAVHLARHGAIAFGDEIEIEQGAEVGAPVHALCARRRDGGGDRACRGRRFRSHRGARRVPAVGVRPATLRPVRVRAVLAK